MRRRDFLLTASGAVASALVVSGPPAAGELASEAGFSAATPASQRRSAEAVIFVPGYESWRAFRQGRPAPRHPVIGRAVPSDYQGPVTLLTRIDEASGQIRRAAYAFQGHAAAVHPDGKIGIFAAIRDHKMIAFDPASLDVIAVSRAFEGGFTGGGHVAFTPDGSTLLVTERYPNERYNGRPEAHYGRLTLREPETLRVLETYSCHGMHPHDLQLLDGRRAVAIANYGSAQPPSADEPTRLPYVVEPCVTILELSSGRLLEKIIAPDRGIETRHLVAPRADRLFIIQVRKGLADEGNALLSGSSEEAVYEADRLVKGDEAYLPTPLLGIFLQKEGPAKSVALMPKDEDLMRHGLSIVHDPRFDEIIATYPGGHAILVADAKSGRIKRTFRTDHLGLRYPSGLALHTDGERYLVTGSFENLYVFRRGSHALDRDSTRHLLFFNHSHIAVA